MIIGHTLCYLEMSTNQSLLENVILHCPLRNSEVLFGSNELRVHAGTDASIIKPAGPPALIRGTRLGECLLGVH